MVEPDPIVTAALGAGAGQIVRGAWDIGKSWIEEYFRKRHPEARARAEANTAVFLGDLAQRVNTLESEADDDEGLKDRFANALSDPDFAIVLQEAIVGSARTSVPEKHELLSRLVTERLRHGADDIVSLAVAGAVEVVPRLSTRMTKFLALTIAIYELRPVAFKPEALTDPSAPAAYREFFDQLLARHLPVPDLSRPELLHLEAQGCLSQLEIISRNLKKTLTPAWAGDFDWGFEDWSLSNPTGVQVAAAWTKLQHIQLTGSGKIIGIFTFDSMSGMKTRIDWSADTTA
jgi:hypothetical protein